VPRERVAGVFYFLGLLMVSVLMVLEVVERKTWLGEVPKG
jgi:uncharacterized membrane protein